MYWNKLWCPVCDQCICNFIFINGNTNWYTFFINLFTKNIFVIFINFFFLSEWWLFAIRFCLIAIKMLMYKCLCVCVSACGGPYGVCIYICVCVCMMLETFYYIYLSWLIHIVNQFIQPVRLCAPINSHIFAQRERAKLRKKYKFSLLFLLFLSREIFCCFFVVFLIYWFIHSFSHLIWVIDDELKYHIWLNVNDVSWRNMFFVRNKIKKIIYFSFFIFGLNVCTMTQDSGY